MQGIAGRLCILRRPRIVPLSAALAVAAIAVPRQAPAAACCISATSFGVGRLLAWEDAAVGLQLGHGRSLGEWTSVGSLRWNGADFSDGLTTIQPWAILRLHDRVQLQGWVPVVVNDRSSGSEFQLAGGLGDAGVAARVEILKIGEYERLPSLAFTIGGLAPTGKRIEETSPPLFAGATGRGAWGASLGVEAEVPLFPWFVRLEGGATDYLPFRRSDTGKREQYSPVFQVSLSSGRELRRDVLIGAVALTAEWEGPIAIDGVEDPRSRARSLALAGSLAWRVDPRWTLTASFTNNVWPDGAGMNRDARLGFTLGVRHGHF